MKGEERRRWQIKKVDKKLSKISANYPSYIISPEKVKRKKSKLREKEMLLAFDSQTTREKLEMLEAAADLKCNRVIVKAAKDSDPIVRKKAMEYAFLRNLDVVLGMGAKDMNFDVAKEAIDQALKGEVFLPPPPGFLDTIKPCIKYKLNIEILGKAARNKNAKVRRELLKRIEQFSLKEDATKEELFIGVSLTGDMLRDKDPEVCAKAKDLYEQIKRKK